MMAPRLASGLPKTNDGEKDMSTLKNTLAVRFVCMATAVLVVTVAALPVLNQAAQIFA
jgi:hypothetical protein